MGLTGSRQSQVPGVLGSRMRDPDYEATEPGPVVQAKFWEPGFVECAVILGEKYLRQGLFFLFFFLFLGLNVFSSRFKQVAPLPRVGMKRAKMNIVFLSDYNMKQR